MLNDWIQFGLPCATATLKPPRLLRASTHCNQSLYHIDAQPRVRGEAPGRAFYFAHVSGGAPLNLVPFGGGRRMTPEQLDNRSVK